MHIDIRGVHLDITSKMKEHIDKKLHRLDFAEEMIIDLLFTVTMEKSSYKIEVTINFRWGTSAHISTDAFDFLVGVDNLFDKVEAKVIKEKEKIKQH